MPAGMRSRKKKKKKKKKKPQGTAPTRLSRIRCPEGMAIDEWQRALRRRFGRSQKFRLKNVGDERYFSEFMVVNPETDGAYRVAIRGIAPGDNFCSCPDFAVNELGTCKHIEFTLAKIERMRGGKKALAVGFAPAYSEVYLRYGAQRHIAWRAGKEAPRKLVRLADRFFDADGVMRPDAFGRFDEFVRAAWGNGHEVRMYDDAVRFVAEVRDREQLARKVDSLLPRGTSSPAFKRLLKTRLYAYQKTGALFAARAGRALIADDMGLGKTIQAIAAAEILARAAGIERVLVVSPTSVKHQWKSEIERFAGREALVVEGLRARRELQYENSSAFFKITNYDVVHRDLDLIERWRPDLVILDEAQRIKNWKTRTARSIKQLDSPYAIVLTGTPLENRLEELHSIVEFVDRFRLGPLYRFLADHQKLDRDGKVVGYRDLSRIGETLAPILVRRTKKEVLKELPERIDKHFFVEMTPEQWDHHDENGEIVARIVGKWRRYGFLSDTDKQRLMMALTNMRMSCDSTYLLDKRTDVGPKADEVVTHICEALERPDSKVVVFSQWLRMHEILIARLEKVAKGRWDHVFFHGSVPGKKRGALIERFREDPSCRAFLATDAAGVGLNLQCADVVINVDLPWNPAVMEQRIGRVHRLGQHRPVRVVNFVARDTIEHGMIDVLAFKKSLFAGALDGGPDEVFMGGSRLKKFMESVEKVSAATPGRASGMGAVTLPAPGTDASDERAAANARRRSPRPKRRSGGSKKRAIVPAPATAGIEAWAPLIEAGRALFEGLASAMQQTTAREPSASGTGGARSRGRGRGDSASGGLAGAASSFIARDERTGQNYLRLPVPSPDVLGRIASVLSTMAEGQRESQLNGDAARQ